MPELKEQIFELYNGFHIDQPLGNNAFSFDQRKRPSIYVPPLIRGSLGDVKQGTEIAFSEIEDGVKKNCRGLKNFVWLNHPDKQIFIFDNHNHAFFFWYWGYITKFFSKNSRLLHIDQHKDIREPIENPPFAIDRRVELKKAWHYTNFVLNVGNFIPPARDIGLIKEVAFIESESDFKAAVPDFDILDLDLDIFAPAMDYIDFDIKFEFIKDAIEAADFITIATSPYFIDQDAVISLIKKLF